MREFLSSSGGLSPRGLLTKQIGHDRRRILGFDVFESSFCGLVGVRIVKGCLDVMNQPLHASIWKI